MKPWLMPLPSALIHSRGSFFSVLATRLRSNSLARSGSRWHPGASKPTILSVVPETAGFHSHLAGHEGLGHIGAGSAVGSAALQQAQLDGTDLGAGSSLDHVGQASSQTAQLGMAKPSVRRKPWPPDTKGAVGIVNSETGKAVLLSA